MRSISKYFLLGVLLSVLTVLPMYGATTAVADPAAELPSGETSAGKLPSAAGDTIHEVGTVKSKSKEKVITDKPGKRHAEKKKKSKKNKKSTTSTKKTPVVLGQTRPLSDFEVGRYQYCGDDRDCIPAVNGCCDCANGGKDVAVNKERFEAFRSRFECIDYRCGNREAENECGTGVVSCINHKCKYFAPGGPEAKF